MTTAWTDSDVRRIDLESVCRVPLITRNQLAPLADGRIYWDMWPVQDKNGHIADLSGREVWMALSAPDRRDPAARHFEAKIRLLERRGDQWIDMDDALPDFAMPYEREWAGSAVVDDEVLTLFFTGAGSQTKPGGFQQALWEASARLGDDGLLREWSKPTQSVTDFGEYYMAANSHEGEAGKIKAFRDPAYFRDPAGGAEYLVFTASMAAAETEFNGAVGIAKRIRDRWDLLPPLVTADGVNNELERAHVVLHEGRYYVFWVTQSSTFAPQLRDAPNGLYGMVSESLFGEYRPLNGSGLVLANPAAEPLQTYSWFVTADLVVSSFVDFHNLKGSAPPQSAADAANVFGGVPAPLLRLEIDGDRCVLAEEQFL